MGLHPKYSTYVVESDETRTKRKGWRAAAVKNPGPAQKAAAMSQTQRDRLRTRHCARTLWFVQLARDCKRGAFRFVVRGAKVPVYVRVRISKQ